jgi:hypothetical protein
MGMAFLEGAKIRDFLPLVVAGGAWRPNVRPGAAGLFLLFLYSQLI